MISGPLSFFTVDHGTASTSAALIAPFGGRFRLLAATAGPSSLPTEAFLKDLVTRVVAVAPGSIPEPEGWADWARLEVVTHRPERIVVAATDERMADAVSETFRLAGWDVVARFAGGHTDPIALTRACLDREVGMVALAASETPSSDERRQLAESSAILAAAAGRRAGLSIVLCGGAASASDAFDSAHVTVLPAAGNDRSAIGSPLHEAALELAGRTADEGPRLPDGRRSLATAVASLASLLEREIDAIDVGQAAGTRVNATADGRTELRVEADAALIPRRAMDADAGADAISRWSGVRAEPSGMRDRLRNLRLQPWRDVAGDGVRLRLAALRAALARLTSDRARPTSDMLVCTGGAYAAIPPPLTALATLDAVRRPGALSMVWDHARLLAPIGSLSSAADRRRLLAELLDDAFLPLAGAIIASDLRPGRQPAILRLESPVGSSEVSLEAGSLRTLDLPPGVTARADVSSRDPISLGVRGRHVVLDVTGGLAGLLLDTREMPLRLPDRLERRRTLLESWERPLWATVPA